MEKENQLESFHLSLNKRHRHDLKIEYFLRMNFSITPQVWLRRTKMAQEETQTPLVELFLVNLLDKSDTQSHFAGEAAKSVNMMP